jgi:hypothetical protein
VPARKPWQSASSRISTNNWDDVLALLSNVLDCVPSIDSKWWAAPASQSFFFLKTFGMAALVCRHQSAMQESPRGTKCCNPAILRSRCQTSGEDAWGQPLITAFNYLLRFIGHVNFLSICLIIIRFSIHICANKQTCNLVWIYMYSSTHVCWNCLAWNLV